MSGQGAPEDHVLRTLWGLDTTMGFRDLSNETDDQKYPLLSGGPYTLHSSLQRTLE